MGIIVDTPECRHDYVDLTHRRSGYGDVLMCKTCGDVVKSVCVYNSHIDHEGYHWLRPGESIELWYGYEMVTADFTHEEAALFQSLNFRNIAAGIHYEWLRPAVDDP